MRTPVRLAVLACSIVCLVVSPAVMAQVPVDDEIIGVAGTADRPVIQPPMFAMTEAQGNLSGITSDVTSDPGNVCFAAVPDVEFTENDVVAINVFFNDRVEDDRFNQYDVTWALRKRGTIFPVGTFACDHDLSAYNPGEVVTLCCVVTEQIPPSPIPIPITINVEWGARVVKLQNGITGQGILGSATVSR